MEQPKKIVSNLTFDQVMKQIEEKKFEPKPIVFDVNSQTEKMMVTDLFLMILAYNTLQVKPQRMLEILNKFQKMIEEQL